MAIACPTELNVDRLRAQIRETYTRLARSPDGDFHFHHGLRYAVEVLRYDRAQLEGLPSACAARFAGVGNPLRIGPLTAGQTVLDHACGSGVDVLLAARRVRAAGRAIGVDMTPAMREQVMVAAAEAGLADIVEVRAGLFEDLPVANASVDVVISNGVVNLAPDKPRVFEEIARVLRPGGRLYLADVVVERELKLEVRRDPELWAGCIAGAVQQEELEALAADAGLVGGRVTERFDCFAGTSAGRRLAPDLFVHSVNFVAEKELNR
jgi:SAM-dependent methyltransferase